MFAVSVRCSPLTVVALPDFLIDHFPLKSTAEFVRLDGLTCDRRDLSQLQAVTEWLSVHLGDGETAYMITDDMLYNPGHLRNCLLPEQPLDEAVAALKQEKRLYRQELQRWERETPGSRSIK